MLKLFLTKLCLTITKYKGDKNIVGLYVKLKDLKRSLSRKNDHNALWH